MDVLNVEAICYAFLIVYLGAILLHLEFSLSEQGIVVNNDLGASSNQLLITCINQRIDFNNLSVSLNEAIVQMQQQEYHLRLLISNAQFIRHL